MDERDVPLVGDVVRLVDSANVGWAGLRRWVLDRGSIAASAGDVHQDPGTSGYRLQRIVGGTRRLAVLPAGYDVLDTSGRAWLRIDVAPARHLRTGTATISAGDDWPTAVVPSVRSSPLGAGCTVTTPDGAPLLVVPDEPGLSWSALDPAGVAVARVEHLDVPAGWVDRTRRAGLGERHRARSDGDPTLSGDIIAFARSATPLHRALVLGVAVCRAHRRT